MTIIIVINIIMIIFITVVIAVGIKKHTRANKESKHHEHKGGNNC